MAATFDPTLPSARDRMRLRLGDTNVGAEKPAEADVLTLPVDDVLYDTLLATNNGDETKATLAIAEALVGRYAVEPDRVGLSGDLDVSWAKRLSGWQALIAQLRKEIAATAAPASVFQVRGPRRYDRDGAPHAEYRREDDY